MRSNYKLSSPGMDDTFCRNLECPGESRCNGRHCLIPVRLMRRRKQARRSSAVQGSMVPGLIKGSGLFFHRGADIEPLLRQFGFFQINFVRYFAHDHHSFSFKFLKVHDGQ